MARVLSSSPKLIGVLPVYDLEVPDGHSYTIHGLVSHNTVSLIAGAIPGCHYPQYDYYIRRVRINNDSPLIPRLIEAGYHVEPDAVNMKTTSVITFPVDIAKYNVKMQEDVSVWQKVMLTVIAQKHWSDNQVSVTVDFDQETEANEIKPILEIFQDQLKSISFLPRRESIVYDQAPYEKISREKYLELSKNLKPLDLTNIYKDKNQEEETDRYCDGDKCMIK